MQTQKAPLSDKFIMHVSCKVPAGYEVAEIDDSTQQMVVLRKSGAGNKGLKYA